MRREFKPFLGLVCVDEDNDSWEPRIIIQVFSNGRCQAVSLSYSRNEIPTEQDLVHFMDVNHEYFSGHWAKWKPIPKKVKRTRLWWECARLFNQLRSGMDLDKEDVVIINAYRNPDNPMVNIGFHADMNVAEWEYSIIDLTTGGINPDWKRFEIEEEVDQ